MKILSYIIISSLLYSCSNIKWSSFFDDDDDDNTKRNEKLMKSFEVEDEVLNKFEVKTEKEPEPQVVEKKKELKKEQPKKVVAKKKSVKKKVVNKSKKTEVDKLPSKFIFPDDYPDNLKKLGKRAEKNWKKFKPILFEGEKFFLDINYMGVSTGRIVISTLDPILIGDKKAYHFNAKVKTSSYYSYLYELDDTVDSYVGVDAHLPLKFSLIQRETDKDVDNLQLFDIDTLKTYSFYKKVTPKKTKKKKKEEYIPSHYVDPLSIIYFLRGLPMIKGNTYEVPIMNQGKIILLNTRVLGTTEIKTKIGTKKAYIMKASTKYSGDTLKSGDMTFWFSADEKRIFLKFEAEIKIGSITGEIEKYEL